MTYNSSPSLMTVPIPHSIAYRLSSLRSLSSMYVLPFRFSSAALGSPWVSLMLHRSLWNTGREVTTDSRSWTCDFVDFLRRGWWVELLSVDGKYGSGGITTLTPSPRGSANVPSSLTVGAMRAALVSVFRSVTGSKWSSLQDSSDSSSPSVSSPDESSSS